MVTKTPWQLRLRRLDDRVLRERANSRRAHLIAIAFFALVAVLYAATVLLNGAEPWGLRLARTSTSVLLMILCGTWLALRPWQRRPGP